MPIDLRQVLADREQELSSLIGSQPGQVASNLASITPGIETFRAKTLSDLAGGQGIDPSAFAAESGRTQGTLGRRLAALQEGVVARGGRQTLGLGLGEKFRRADRARAEQVQGEGFSRQNEADIIGRGYQSDALNKEIEHQKKMADLQDYYSTGANNEEGDDTGYQAALYRALFGLTGGVGTGLAMGGWKKNPITPINYTLNPNVTGISNGNLYDYWQSANLSNRNI